LYSNHIPYLDSENYRLGVAAIPSYYTDSWKDSYSDFEYGAFRWMSEMWLEYKSFENLSWQLGFRYKPEHELQIVPIVSLNYVFNDKWSFRLTPDDVNLIYAVNDKFQILTEHRYVLDEYEISSGGIDGRVLRHKQNTTGLGFQYNWSETIQTKLSFGAAYNRSFKFTEDEQGKAVLDDTVYAAFEIKAAF
jgi:hypothetical protein